MDISRLVKQLCLLLVVTAALAFGQQPPPTNFMAVGGAYNPYTRPSGAGWATYARLIDLKSETYFFTTEDITSTKQKPYIPQTSVRVGFGTKLKEIGPVKLFAIVDGGGASSSDGAGGAASGGTMATIRFGQSSMYGIGGFRILKIQNVSGTPKLYEGGIGWIW